MGDRRRTLILGAAGRDFHVFNTVFRDAPASEVVAFTATQIPGIDNRTYPPSLAGPLYPNGIPIIPQARWEATVRDEGIDEVILAFSDIAHADVMHIASKAVALGADFRLVGAEATMLRSSLPVVSVCAVRTGCGKSAVSRFVARLLRALGLRVGVIRHPMPYGDLERQAVQRFATLADLDEANCTIEEREEYEPHIVAGAAVFAGVDYERILRLAEAESDVILWDGGNNDLPFIRPDLELVLVDPHRPGHETAYYPGEANLLRADVIVVAKSDTAEPSVIAELEANARAANAGATIVRVAMPPRVEGGETIAGKRVLVVEDGPTVTHGEMPGGAGLIAARAEGATPVDPRPFATGSLREAYDRYPWLGPVLPAMGYSEAQVAELKATIEAVPCDAVLVASPEDLRRVLHFEKPAARVSYEAEDGGEPSLSGVIEAFAKGVAARRSRP